MIKKTFFFAGLMLSGTSVVAMSLNTYTHVMEIVDARDLTTLQQMVSDGLNLNSPQPNGMTPLCETVMTNDYEGYELLQTQGASPYVPCMRHLPQEQVAEFYANQPKPNTYYTGKMMAAHSTKTFGAPFEFPFPTLGVGEVLLGGVAVAGILTLGHGGSGGGGIVPVNKYKWDAPLSLNPDDFSATKEYQSLQIPTSEGVRTGLNYLGAINAANAYARGYTGYKIKRAADGALQGTGEAAISTDKVTVAVVDNGVYTAHTDLDGNIAGASQWNYVYGVCSAGNTGRCWKWTESSIQPAGATQTYGVATLYANWNESTQEGTPIGSNSGIAKGIWQAYAYRYRNVTYSSAAASPVAFEQWLGDDYETYQVIGVPGSGTDMTWYAYDGVNDPYLVTIEDGKYYITKGIKIELVKQQTVDTHGTMVAGLVAAENSGLPDKPYGSDSGMMGVAYNAEIVPVRMDDTFYSAEGLKEAVSKADILNFSTAFAAPEKTSGGSALHDKDALVGRFDDFIHTLNLQSANYESALKSAAIIENSSKASDKTGTILVFAAGNYGRDSSGKPFESSRLSMAPLSQYFNGTTKSGDGNIYNLTNLFVNVVALDRNNQLASYSAQCGVTKDYCIAAPGGDGDGLIYSTSVVAGTTGALSGTYEGASGTSFATPVVSGALAVIKGAFPHLTNQQVVQILFETATDLGEPGVDDVYGHGLVNLDAATSPIGLPKIVFSTTTTGFAVNASSSLASVPSAFAGVVSALPSHMVVLDKYQRAFQVSTASFVHVTKRENKFEGRFKSFMSGDEKVVADTDKLQMAYSERHSKLSSQMKQGSVRFELKPTPKWSFKTFYTENTETSGGSYFDRLMLSPYGKMKEAWGGAVSYDLTKNWQATVLGQVGKNGFVDEDELRRMDHNKSSLFQSTLQYNGLKKVSLKVAAGVANEQGSVLGMWGKGAFKFGNSHTNFVGAGVTLHVTDAIKLEGMYYKGTTKASNPGSLIRMSDIKSDSFALTAAWQVNDARTLGLQFVSPLRVRKGIANVDLPVGRDAYQDIVYRQTVQADLKPSAREYDVGLYYTDLLKEDMQFQSELGVRLNPDHVSGAAPDWRALVGLKLGL